MIAALDRVAQAMKYQGWLLVESATHDDATVHVYMPPNDYDRRRLQVSYSPSLPDGESVTVSMNVVCANTGDAVNAAMGALRVCER